MNTDSIHDQIHQKYLSSDTGFSLHYSFLYSLVLGLEAKHVFEFGSGFSTHCILHALEITGGELSSCDVRTTDENKAITDYTKKSSIWNFIHGHSNLALQNHQHAYYDLILHDGSHTCDQVVRDLDNIFPFLKQDGLLLVHDTTHPDLGNEMMDAVNQFSKNRDLDLCTLPYGYGLTIIHNKTETAQRVKLSWEKKR